METKPLDRGHVQADDMRLIERPVAKARLAWLPGTVLLICVDGLPSYVSAFWRAFGRRC